MNGEQVRGRVIEVLEDSDTKDTYKGLIIRKEDGSTEKVLIEEIDSIHIQEGGQWPHTDQLLEYIELWEQGKISIGTNFVFDVDKIPPEQK